MCVCVSLRVGVGAEGREKFSFKKGRVIESEVLVLKT